MLSGILEMPVITSLTQIPSPSSFVELTIIFSLYIQPTSMLSQTMAIHITTQVIKLLDSSKKSFCFLHCNPLKAYFFVLPLIIRFFIFKNTAIFSYKQFSMRTFALCSCHGWSCEFKERYFCFFIVTP